MKRRGAIVWETLIPYIIALAVLVLVGVIYFILYGKGHGALDFVKNFLRLGNA